MAFPFSQLANFPVEKDFKGEFEDYLMLCETPNVKTLGELIQFNKEHSDKELPPGVLPFVYIKYFSTN